MRNAGAAFRNDGIVAGTAGLAAAEDAGIADVDIIRAGGAESSVKFKWAVDYFPTVVGHGFDLIVNGVGGNKTAAVAKIAGRVVNNRSAIGNSFRGRAADGIFLFKSAVGFGLGSTFDFDAGLITGKCGFGMFAGWSGAVAVVAEGVDTIAGGEGGRGR